MRQAWCSHLGVVRLAGSAGSWRRAEHDDIAQLLPRRSRPGGFRFAAELIEHAE